MLFELEYLCKHKITSFREVIIISILIVLFESANCQNKFNNGILKTKPNAHSIKSMGVLKDYNTFMFLKDEIDDKRFVWLGENNHLTKENNQLKYRLIEFLHEQLGFNAVIFESGTGNCGISNLAKSQLNPFEFLYTSLIGAWRTEDNCSMMEFFKQSPMDLAGMDPNYKARYLPKRAYDFIFDQNKKMAESYYLLDSMNSNLAIEMSNLYHSDASLNEKNKVAADLNAKKDKIKKGYGQLLDKISLQDINPEIRDKKALMIIKLGLKNNIFDLSKDLTKFKNDTAYWLTNRERDSIMARNIEFLVDSIYTNEKVIVWAHNFHIRKRNIEQPQKSSSLETISFFLPEEIKEESFVIALFADSGEQKCLKHSLFRICRDLSLGIFYLNTRISKGNSLLKQTDYWTNKKYPVCKKGKVTRTLADSYDAFFYIPNSHHSVLLNSDPFKKRKND